jgi:hypothetical protein
MPDTTPRTPFSGETRAVDGAIVYFTDGTRQRAVMRSGERVLRCVEEALEVAKGWPGEWKVEVISTPTTIWRDLQGQRFTTSRGGRYVLGKMPEEQLLALIGRLDALAA